MIVTLGSDPHLLQSGHGWEYSTFRYFVPIFCVGLRRSSWPSAQQVGARVGGRVLYIAGIAFGLALLAYQTWRGVTAMRQYELCVWRPTYLVSAVGIYITAYLVQMSAWAMLMRSMQAPLSVDTVLRGYVLSFLPRYIPGTVWGYLSRSEWLLQAHNIPYALSTIVSFLEAALFLVTAMALGVFYWADGLWKVGIAVGAPVAISATWLLIPKLANRFGGQRFQLPQEAHQDHRLGILVVALYFLFWVLQGTAILVISNLVCVTSPIPLMAAIAASGLAWVLGFVILFVPTGLGIREWTLSALLVAFAGVDSGQADMIAVVSRVLVIAAEIVALFIGLQRQLLFHIRRR